MVASCVRLIDTKYSIVLIRKVVDQRDLFFIFYFLFFIFLAVKACYIMHASMRSMDQWINQSVDQWIMQRISRSADQPISRSCSA